VAGVGWRIKEVPTESDHDGLVEGNGEPLEDIEVGVCDPTLDLTLDHPPDSGAVC
jgi:hypothetical protein